MPYTDHGLPFAACSQESFQAAQHAAESRESKTRKYLRHLAQQPSTDHEAAAALGWPLSSINSIRNGVALLVEKTPETRESMYGHPCRVYALNRAGRAVVEVWK
jgi:hypothetical protein